MNTIRHIANTLMNGFNEAEFPERSPHAICIWKDSRQQWRAGARRLATFPLQHFNHNAPEYLYFDSAKSVYFPRSAHLNELPTQIYDAVVDVLTRLNSQYGRAHMVVYERASQEDAFIAVEQAAQVIARAHEAIRNAGQEPPPICELSPATKHRQQDAAAPRIPQWLTALPDMAKEAMREGSHPEDMRESTFSAMLDAYASATKEEAPASFTSSMFGPDGQPSSRHAKLKKRVAAAAKKLGKFDFGCAPTQPLPL